MGAELVIRTMGAELGRIKIGVYSYPSLHIAEKRESGKDQKAPIFIWPNCKVITNLLLCTEGRQIGIPPELENSIPSHPRTLSHHFDLFLRTRGCQIKSLYSLCLLLRTRGDQNFNLK
ncbi:hypothetical protein GQ457_01G011270 [Hibiscus cannabinus]